MKSVGEQTTSYKTYASLCVWFFMFHSQFKALLSFCKTQKFIVSNMANCNCYCYCYCCCFYCLSVCLSACLLLCSPARLRGKKDFSCIHSLFPFPFPFSFPFLCLFLSSFYTANGKYGKNCQITRALYLFLC